MTELIIEYTSREFGVHIEDMKSKSRKRELVYARFAAMKLMRDYTRLSLAEIGAQFGRSHADVLYGLIVHHNTLMGCDDYAPFFNLARVCVEREANKKPIPDVWAGSICRHAETELI